MNQVKMFIVGLSCMALSSCGSLGTGAESSGSNAGNILGGVLGAITNGDAIGNVLTSIIGLDKPTEAQLHGTWQYVQPGVAFTSESALAQAGGEVAATQVKEKLMAYYQNFGVNSTNTVIQLNADKTFSAKIAGRTISGTYTYDAAASKLNLKTLLFTMPCYAKRTTKGMSFLLESKKLLTLLQTVATISGNSSLQTIGDLSKNYDGIRMGFDMSRQR